MKNYLSCHIEPFDLKQKINICKNNRIVDTVECDFVNLEKALYELCKTHNIEDVMLKGNTLYGMKLQQNLINYNKDTPINIIFCA